MRSVRDESGTHYLLLKRSGDSSRVRDPETGEEQYFRTTASNPSRGSRPS